MTPTYETVTIARNEALNVGHTLDALEAQSRTPAKMIVVDDGSVDGTAEVAAQFGCEVVRLPFHARSYLGLPVLALVINSGLARVSAGADYVVIVDADNPLPRNYMGTLLDRMEEDVRIAATSGVLLGEPVDLEMPRNSGFMVRASAWRKLNGMRYPLMYGYEGWLRFKLMQEGYRVRVYTDVVSSTRRKTRLKGLSDGRAMYALGYGPVYAAGRAIVNLRSQPAESVGMLVGYFAHGDAERSDVAGWVRERQKARLWGKVSERLAVPPS